MTAFTSALRIPSSRLLNAASTVPDGDVCAPVVSLRDARGVADGVACVAGAFETVFGVGEGFGGAMVRVRVEGAENGSVVELFVFCANAQITQASMAKKMAISRFIVNLPDTALVT